jgi:hypothetical protein
MCLSYIDKKLQQHKADREAIRLGYIGANNKTCFLTSFVGLMHRGVYTMKIFGANVESESS